MLKQTINPQMFIRLALLLGLLWPGAALAQEDDDDKTDRELREDAIAQIELTQEVSLAEGLITLQIPERWDTLAQGPGLFIARDQASLEALLGAVEGVFDEIEQGLNPNATPAPTPTPPPPGATVLGIMVLTPRENLDLPDDPTGEDVLAALNFTPPPDAEGVSIIESEIDGHQAVTLLADADEDMSGNAPPEDWPARSVASAIVYPEHVLVLIGISVDPEDQSLVFEAIMQSVQADVDGLQGYEPPSLP